MTTVLHIADYAAPYPGAFIGQLRMLDDEVRRRGRSRCAFAFPAMAAGHDWFQRQRADGSPTRTVSTSAKRGLAGTAAELTRVIADSDAAIVHTHFGGYDLAAALAVARLRRRGHDCRLVWHYRTALETPVDARGPLHRAKDVVRFRLPAPLVDRCFAVTHALADEAARRGMGHRASAMVAGCDTATFAPDPAARIRIRESLGLAPADVMIMHLGWHWHRKGGDLLAAAATIAQAQFTGRLHVVSVGAPASVPPVTALPFTDRIRDVYAAADIFVSASRSEGFGNGVAEAMSCGSVVVAALATGQREVFRDAPGCVAAPVDDADALAAGITDLLARQAQWRELGASNRAHVIEHHDMRDWASRMADAYDELSPVPVEPR